MTNRHTIVIITDLPDKPNETMMLIDGNGVKYDITEAWHGGMAVWLSECKVIEND